MLDTINRKKSRAPESSSKPKESLCAGHVGMLVHSHYPADQRVRREAEALAEAGFRVDVICLRYFGSSQKKAEVPWERIRGVYVHRLPLSKKRGTALRYLFEYGSLIGFGMFKLAILHIARRLDAVHIHNMPDFLVAAGVPFKWLGAKLVLDIHDPMPEIFQSMNPSREQSWMYRALALQESWSCRQAKRVVIANQVLTENLVRKGLPPEKALTINNFPDPRYFAPPTSLPPWPKREGQLTLIYAGTITKHYQVEDAIYAVSMLAGEVPGIRLLLVGSGRSVAPILDLAAALGIGDRVTHRHRVDQKTLHSLVNDADVGVSTHIGGPFGNLVFTQKILDYMSQGLPVIANRAQANTRHLPEEAVYYYESGRPREFADQILRMIRDPEDRQRKRELGLKICGSFSWTTEKRKFVSFYRELIGPNGKRKQRPEGLAI